MPGRSGDARRSTRAGQRIVRTGQRIVRTGQRIVRTGQRIVRTGQKMVRAVRLGGGPTVSTGRPMPMSQMPALLDRTGPGHGR